MRHFNKHRFMFVLVCILLGGLLSAGLLTAQETRGSIVGKVTDQSSAVVPKATVVVTNTAW